MALNAVAAAAVAGVASTAVCHPLDTIRTRLQTASLSANANASASGHHGSGGVYYRGPLDCLAQTVRHEGVGALYKGLAAPLAAQAVYKAVIFGSYGQASEALGSNAHAAGSAARLWRVFACGCFAGSVNALVVCPIELVRNRLMVQSSAAGQQRFRGALDCVRQTVRTERGGPLALWRGVSSTVLRDGPGLGLWFVSFELSKQALQASAGLPTDSTANLFLSGAAGGCAFWLVALPFDTIKANVQTNLDTSKRRVSNLGIARALGVRGLYRGLSVALLRGIPGAGVVFVVQKRVLDFLNDAELASSL